MITKQNLFDNLVAVGTVKVLNYYVYTMGMLRTVTSLVDDLLL